MIFVTVGSQMPFDRMIEMVDEWSAQNPNQEVIAQIGNTNREFKNLKTYNLLTPKQFSTYVKNSDLMIAHAGMGSILTSREYGKNILVMPRQSQFKETRNDHQIATANRLKALGLLKSFESLDQLNSLILETVNASEMDCSSRYVADAVAKSLQKIIEGM